MADYLKFTDEELTNSDQQPSLHMHWGYESTKDRNQWLWDTDATIKAQRAAAVKRDRDISALELQTLRAMRELLISSIQRGDIKPSPSTEQLLKLDAQIKEHRQAVLT